MGCPALRRLSKELPWAAHPRPRPRRSRPPRSGRGRRARPPRAHRRRRAGRARQDELVAALCRAARATSCRSSSSPTTSSPPRTPTSLAPRRRAPDRAHRRRRDRVLPAHRDPRRHRRQPRRRRDARGAARPVDLTLVESGGDNLTAIFSRGLVDVQIFVLDTAGGDDVPRKGGPGVAARRPARDQQDRPRAVRRRRRGGMVADAVARRDGRPVVTIVARARTRRGAESPTGCGSVATTWWA